jgi:hypothetical protein
MAENPTEDKPPVKGGSIETHLQQHNAQCDSELALGFHMLGALLWCESSIVGRLTKDAQSIFGPPQKDE